MADSKGGPDDAAEAKLGGGGDAKGDGAFDADAKGGGGGGAAEGDALPPNDGSNDSTGDYDVKVILLGDSAVGKSKLVERYMMGNYNPRQVGVLPRASGRWRGWRGW